MSALNELFADHWILVVFVVLGLVVVIALLVENYDRIVASMSFTFYRLFGDAKMRKNIKSREKLYHKQERQQQEMQWQRLNRYIDDKNRHDTRRH